ncbi:MAG: hypothetical protein AVDCRST_MAG12-3759, partial [uncultured Rubrobacteraceae bacterium]
EPVHPDPRRLTDRMRRAAGRKTRREPPRRAHRPPPRRRRVGRPPGDGDPRHPPSWRVRRGDGGARADASPQPSPPRALRGRVGARRDRHAARDRPAPRRGGRFPPVRPRQRPLQPRRTRPRRAPDDL